MDQEPSTQNNTQINKLFLTVYQLTILTLVPDFSSSFNIGLMSLDNYVHIKWKSRSKDKVNKNIHLP